jgi:hypothetical protein
MTKLIAVIVAIVRILCYCGGLDMRPRFTNS